MAQIKTNPYPGKCHDALIRYSFSCQGMQGLEMTTRRSEFEKAQEQQQW